MLPAGSHKMLKILIEFSVFLDNFFGSVFFFSFFVLDSFGLMASYCVF